MRNLQLTVWQGKSISGTIWLFGWQRRRRGRTRFRVCIRALFQRLWENYQRTSDSTQNVGRNCAEAFPLVGHATEALSPPSALKSFASSFWASREAKIQNISRTQRNKFLWPWEHGIKAEGENSGMKMFRNQIELRNYWRKFPIAEIYFWHEKGAAEAFLFILVVLLGRQAFKFMKMLSPNMCSLRMEMWTRIFLVGINQTIKLGRLLSFVL